MKSNPADVYTAFQGLAAPQGDIGNVRDHHGVVLHKAPDAVEVKCDCSTSLLQIGEIEEALAIARRAFEQACNDAGILRHLVGIAIEAGHFRYAREVCVRWHELFSEEEAPCERAVEDLVDALERGVFTERHAQAVLRIAHEERGAAKLRMAHSVVRPDHIEPDGFLHTIYVLASNDVAVHVNERIIEKILDHEELMAEPVLKFMPMVIGTI